MRDKKGNFNQENRVASDAYNDVSQHRLQFFTRLLMLPEVYNSTDTIMFFREQSLEI